MKGKPLTFARGAVLTIAILFAASGCARRDNEQPSARGGPISPSNPSSPALEPHTTPDRSRASSPSGADAAGPVVRRDTPAGGAPTTHASQPQTADAVVATVKGLPITLAQLQRPLIEAYGLNMLAKIAQLQVASQDAKSRNVQVTEQDVAAETERYLATLFNEDRDPVLKQMNGELERAQAANDAAKVAQVREDLRRERERLLDQLLQQQKLTRADFDLVMQINTHLRKVALATVDKNQLSDDALRQAFNTLYGEKAQVRHVALNNIQEATEAKRRLAEGQPFEQVAREMSRNQQSGALGGELPPFTRDSPGYPQQFKDVAFGLQQGQVSDPVAADGAYHLIRLEQKVPPKLMKFDDVKEDVREYLYDRLIESRVRELRNEVQREVVTTLVVRDPELKRQYDAQVNRINREDELRDRTDIRRELERRRQQISTERGGDGQPPTTVPATAPATPPTTGPTTTAVPTPPPPPTQPSPAPATQSATPRR